VLRRSKHYSRARSNRSPAPGENGLRGPGDPLGVGDTVGPIEVMKSLTPVVAEQAGVLFQVENENENAAMAGQPLCDLEV